MCKSVSVNGSFINENGQQENLYDLGLNCYGDSASARNYTSSVVKEEIKIMLRAWQKN